jgi:hypothetical protein
MGNATNSPTDSGKGPTGRVRIRIARFTIVPRE